MRKRENIDTQLPSSYIAVHVVPGREKLQAFGLNPIE